MAFEFKWRICIPPDVLEKAKLGKPGDEFGLPDGTKLVLMKKGDDDFWDWFRGVVEDAPKTKLVQLDQDGNPARCWEMEPGVTVTELDLEFERFTIPPEMEPDGEA